MSGSRLYATGGILWVLPRLERFADSQCSPPLSRFCCSRSLRPVMGPTAVVDDPTRIGGWGPPPRMPRVAATQAHSAVLTRIGADESRGTPNSKWTPADPHGGSEIILSRWRSRVRIPHGSPSILVQESNARSAFWFFRARPV